MSAQVTPSMCQAMAWTADYWHRFPCTRKAKRAVNGHVYCEQHAKMAEKGRDVR